ncbi:octopamine receptor beta-3R-like isoform X1 [Tigriopus californicus]|uniref:octopamine receptor beta-3R-like isoform X1 n=2 Tax=Tigriopus californicus TaxID=6832 RepID=UPI0027D9DC57|nr:octopamine receptor beta-3R-like isoform X1 [Tigriopus californicus]
MSIPGFQGDSTSMNITLGEREQLASIYLQNFCLGLVTLFTILGNGFIILCISLHRVLQRPSHIFIASLASTDLLLGLTVMTPRLISELIQKWIFGFRLCQIYHAMDVTLCTASILHLSCIAMDRYYAIVNQPLLYYQRITPKRVALSVALCWILSILTGFVPVFTGIYTSHEHLALSKANPEECNLVVNAYFSVLAGVVSFWIPGSIMVFVYYQVYQETQRLHNSTPSLGELRQDCFAHFEEENPSHIKIYLSQKPLVISEVSRKHHDRESRAAKTLGIVMGIFLICWLPFFIWMPLTGIFDLHTPSFVYTMILWVGYGNSVVNPFIYGFFNREFKGVILGDLKKLGLVKANSPPGVAFDLS